MTYPTVAEVKEMFSNMETRDQQWKMVEFLAPDGEFQWTQQGSTPISGTWTDRKTLTDGCFMPLFNVVDGQLIFKTKNVFVSDDGQAVVQIDVAEGKCKNGKPYHQKLCWVVKFNKDKKMTKVDQYWDTAEFDKNWKENVEK